MLAFPGLSHINCAVDVLGQLRVTVGSESLEGRGCASRCESLRRACPRSRSPAGPSLPLVPLVSAAV